MIELGIQHGTWTFKGTLEWLDAHALNRAI